METQTNQQKKKSSIGRVIISVILLVIVGWFFFGGGLEQQAQHQMDDISNQVAEDAIKQYEIVKKSGTEIECYTQASLVAAAYLQAKDEENYQKWKNIEKQHADAAGMPQ